MEVHVRISHITLAIQLGILEGSCDNIIVLRVMCMLTLLHTTRCIKKSLHYDTIYLYIKFMFSYIGQTLPRIKY